MAALVVALGACSSGSSGDGEAVVVDMFDNRFEPVELTVEAGTEVVFRGAGRNPHNAVASDGSWTTEDSFGSLEQFEGDNAAVVFNTPGTYDYFCTFHGNADGQGMAGTLNVVAEGSG